MKAVVNKIIRFSNVDGPGNRMAVFLQGCNFHCRYCHNPETINFCNNCGICIENCPAEALSFEQSRVIRDKTRCINCDSCLKICNNNSSPKTSEYSVEELLSEVDKLKNFVSGITFSGGECTLQYKFIAEFFKEIKTRYPRLSCFVDTNGFFDFSEKIYKDFLENTDSFMLDVKAFDKEFHQFITGQKNDTVLKNLNFLKKINKLYEVRTVIIKGFPHNKFTVEEVSRSIAHGNTRYKLIKFRSIGVTDTEFMKMASPENKELDELKKLAENIGVKEVLVI